MVSPALFSRESDEWRTPPALFNALNIRFDFDLDPAATPENALCRRYFTSEEDGLAQPWNGRSFLNPPYSHVKEWVEKAASEAARGCLVVALVPARTDTAWFQRAMDSADIVQFIPGRLHFRLPDGRPGGSAPFPSAILFWGGFKLLDARALR